MAATSIPIKFALSHPAHFLSLGCGSGLITPAPGTWGTLASVPFYFLIMAFIEPSQIIVYSAVLLLTFVFGVYCCGKTSHDLGVHDHGSIVWDEFIGFWITMFLVTPSVLSVVLGFVLFRIFDILKPWPIGVIDKSVDGGLGIMLDDVFAGIMACVVLHILLRFI